MQKIISEDIQSATNICFGVNESELISEATKHVDGGYFKITKKMLKDGAADDEDIEAAIDMVDDDTDVYMTFQETSKGDFIVMPEGKKDLASFVKYIKAITSIKGKDLDKSYKKGTKAKGGDVTENDNISPKWLDSKILAGDEVYGYHGDVGEGKPVWEKVSVVWDSPKRWSFSGSSALVSLIPKTADKGHKGSFIVLDAKSKKGGSPE